MKVIFNADDFGLHRSVSLGILESIKDGVVRSTTVLANVIAPEQKAWLRKVKELNGSFGVHLCLTLGKPLTNFPEEYLTEDGRFNRQVLFSPMGIPRLSRDVIFRELSAQIEEVLAYEPAHLDSHHHIHGFWNVFEVVKELALKLKLPVRAITTDMRDHLRSVGITCADLFIDRFFGKNNLTVENLQCLLKNARAMDAKVVEVMCHPGFMKDFPAGLSSYIEEREIELQVLRTPSLRAFFEEEGIEVASYEAV